MLRWIGLSFISVGMLMAAGSNPSEFFEMKVRPVLATQCFSCHTQTKMGGLDLSSRESAIKGGTRGAAIKPGDPDNSLLLKAVRQSDPALKMPPSGKLSDADIEALALWIRNGAEWPNAIPATPKAAGYRITPEQRQWWSFRPVVKPTAPAVKNAAWIKTEIDRFILAKLEQQNLKPVNPADRRALLRRAYYDLTGLPPSIEEVEAFERDLSPRAFENVIDKLLASPHYGERWGRYWLDVARYSDDKLNSTQDDPYANAWRYRDWVIGAFNRDLPYDLFLKAQIAGDLLPDSKAKNLVAGLGFYALSPEFQDDRVDATTRGLLGLTVACAQCHDHKFDPIPTKDYYALLGVFNSTKLGEYPLAPGDEVKRYKAAEAKIDDKKKEIEEFLDKQATQLAEILAARSAAYLKAARNKDSNNAALDKETVERWVRYLNSPTREHPYLKGWDQPGFDDDAFQQTVLNVIAEKKKVEETNFIRLSGSTKRGDLAGADLLSLERDKYFLWRDLTGKDKFGKFESGILYYKEDKIARFLSGQWKEHLDLLRTDLETRKKALPEQYPYFHIVRDVEKPKNQRIMIRGSRDNLGDEAPRAFLSILSPSDPKPFEHGSGRLELAEAVASKDNPLTARVIVNRIWMNHFGTGIVRTPSNFGQLGERPSHPELLDYLAARLMEQGWSIKKLHKEIMLSSVYQLSARSDAANFTADPDNRMLWRFNRRRLDIEPLRDTLLAVTGELEPKAGGPPQKINEASNHRRTVYSFVSRRKLDGTLALFDFPNPNSLSELRIQTATPLQQLFFMNSGFLEDRARALSSRLSGAGGDISTRIRAAYRLLYQRDPSAEEIKLGSQYVAAEKDGWQRYAQVLLSANELIFVN